MGEMNWLKFVPRRTCRVLPFVWLAPLLAACAGNMTQPAAQATSLTGQLRLGTVISVRPAVFDGTDAVVQKILVTLNVSAPTEQEAVELVIRRQDNSVVSIVQPAGPGQPDFVSGEHVAIVEAANTVVRPQ
ncbi:hypothetical protein [Acidocella sp.]|jgi:outer membrane lipoprotein SlyB|uniref:hypothetical protein n=1 Tax=Acidocella sp. TaxID=50710 RepID=UPI002F3F9706